MLRVLSAVLKQKYQEKANVQLQSCILFRGGERIADKTWLDSSTVHV
jgi:hypothetical protein